MPRIASAVWGVWHHAITTIAFYTRGHSTRQRVRDCGLKELPVPDLDQIKQGEQGARDRRGRFAPGSAEPLCQLLRFGPAKSAALRIGGIVNSTARSRYGPMMRSSPTISSRQAPCPEAPTVSGDFPRRLRSLR